MTDVELLANKIAASLAERLTPAIPVDIDLWDIKVIAAYLKRDPDSVRDRIISAPDFPKAIRLPTQGETKRSRPLWRAKDVIRWAESYIEGRPGAPGRPREQ
jgi:hypothetical protein